MIEWLAAHPITTAYIVGWLCHTFYETVTCDWADAKQGVEERGVGFSKGIYVFAIGVSSLLWPVYGLKALLSVGRKG